jgi:hypothetical protein
MTSLQRSHTQTTNTLVAGDHATGYGYDYDVEGYLDRGMS